jgi:hypothetical protein
MPKRTRSSTRDSGVRTRGKAPPPKQGISPPEATPHQTAVWLTDEETGWIDARLLEMKRAGWRGVTRSACIRALIRATMQRAPDVGSVTNEMELAPRLRLR